MRASITFHMFIFIEKKRHGGYNNMIYKAARSSDRLIYAKESVSFPTLDFLNK